MSWTSSRIEMPEEWWDALRKKERLPSWFRELTQFVSQQAWTHMLTLTFRNPVRDPFQAAKLYCRFRAALSSTALLTADCWAVEQHPGGHGSHIHALWKTQYDALRACSLRASSPQANSAQPEPLYRLVKTASERWLGFSRLWPIDGEKSPAAAYALKYIVKGLKKLDGTRTPMPWEPQEREPLWGMWTRQT